MLLDSSFKVAFFWSSSSCDNDISSGPMVAWLMHRWPNVLSRCCDDSSWQGCISWNRSFAFDQWAMTCNHCAPRSTQTCAADLERSVSKALLHCILSHCWTGQGSERWDRQGRRATAKALPRLYQHLCAKKRSYGRWFNLFLKAWNTSWLHQTRRNACQWGMAACSQPSDMQNIWEDSDSERKWDCWWRCKPGWNPNFIRAHVFVLKVTWWIWQPLDVARAIWMVCFSDSRPCQQEFVSNMFAILGCIRRLATRFARLTMPSMCWFQLAFHRQLYVALIYI